MQINDAGGVKKLLFNWGFARKLFYIKRGLAHDKVRAMVLWALLLDVRLSSYRCSSLIWP
jgi:hypothetical protein